MKICIDVKGTDREKELLQSNIPQYMQADHTQIHNSMVQRNNQSREKEEEEEKKKKKNSKKTGNLKSSRHTLGQKRIWKDK